MACAAAVALAVAGCKVDVPAAAGTDPAAGPGPAAGQGSDPGFTRSGPLIIEPGAGFSFAGVPEVHQFPDRVVPVGGLVVSISVT